MPESSRRQVEVTNALGFHMRAATLLFKCLSSSKWKFESPVTAVPPMAAASWI